LIKNDVIILAFALSDQFTKEMVLSGKKNAVILKHLKICTTYIVYTCKKTKENFILTEKS